MKIAVCEDNPKENARLCSILKQSYPDAVIEQFYDGDSLLKYLESNKPDIVILDVEMPGKNGIETAKKLRELNPLLGIIFATAHPDYALDAFSVYAYDYILKPVDRERLANSINKLLNREHEDDNYINILNKGMSFKVRQKDIIFIEKVFNKCVVTTEKFTYSMITSLKYFEKHLNPELFIRTHKAFIVNRNKVRGVISRGNLAYDIQFYNTEKKAILSRGMNNKLELLTGR